MRNLRESVSRAIGLLRRGRPADELGDELKFHIEMLEEQFRRQGMDAETARRTAHASLGGVTQTLEAYADQQTIPHFERLLQDLRYGARALLRTPAFSAAALLTVALGIGANVAIFSVVYAVLLRPLPYAASERLVTIGDRPPGGSMSNIGFATFQDFRDRNRTLEFLTAIRSWQPTLVANGEAERLAAMRVSWNYFTMLGASPALGRNFTPSDDRRESPGVVLLSDGLWRRRFGADPRAVGRRIRMNDVDFEIVGVMPATFEPLISARFYQPAEIWAPLRYDTTLSYACRSCQHLKAIGKVKPGVTEAQVLGELSAIRGQLVAEHPSDYPAGNDMALQPLSDAIAGPVRPTLLVLLGAVGFVLLIACANVANLLLARSLNRSREMAVRAALGASRMRLIRQMLTESTMLSVAGGALGVTTAALLLTTLDRVAPVDIPRLDTVRVDAPVLIFALALSVLTGLAFGLFPALRVSATRLSGALSSNLRVTSSSNRARSALVIADVALALVLLTGAGLMLRSVEGLVRANPGFDASRVLTMQFSLVGEAYREDAAVVSFQDRLLEGLRALRGVEGVALAGQIPMGGNGDTWGFHIEGKGAANPAEDPSAERYSVTPDYFRVMGIPLLRGRLITDGDKATSEQVLVISEATATLWGGDDPIGRRVRIGAPDSPWRTVVGIAADVRHEQLSESARTQMYLPQAQVTDSFLVVTLRAREGHSDRLAAQAREVLRALDPTVPVYAVAMLEDLVSKSYEDRRFVMRLLAAFAVVALLLAAVGLYGVIAFVVSQRTREVGVRLALGARPSDILRLVFGTGALSVGIGLLLGIVGAALLTRTLDSLLYGVPATDPLSLGAAVGVLTAVALAAHLGPALRALKVDPVIALRTD